VSNSHAKLLIGILGGVGSGKSTVASLLAEKGCALIDADKIARTLLEEQKFKDKVIAAFGSSAVDSAGNISREKLGDVVFANQDKLKILNDILHPPVLRRILLLIEEYNKKSSVAAIVLDMPLLVEIGWEKHCDRLIFVRCDRQKRLKRAQRRHFLDEKRFNLRENSQISLDIKVSIADNVINNNVGLAELSEQITEIFSNIVKRNPG